MTFYLQPRANTRYYLISNRMEGNEVSSSLLIQEEAPVSIHMALLPGEKSMIIGVREVVVCQALDMGSLSALEGAVRKVPQHRWSFVDGRPHGGK
jgi:hypothetical protein